MQYFEWINKYQNGELSAADQQAFEHEISENPKLRAELKATQLTEALLQEGSMHRNSILDHSYSSMPFRQNRYFVLALGLMFLVVPLFIWQYYSSFDTGENVPHDPTPKNIEISPGTPIKQPFLQKPPIASVSLQRETNQKAENVKQPSTAASKKALKPKKESSPSEDRVENSYADKNEKSSSTILEEKIAVYTVRAVLDTVLIESSNIALTATEAITLKPGFHAKAGTYFKAQVRNGPLFEKSSATN